MGSTQPSFRRALISVSTGALAVALIAGFSLSAQADTTTPTPVSSTALPTAQVNGVVWTQAVVNGVDYVGGSFSQSQPAGAADGVDVTSRANLFAYDVTTGVALPGFSATTNAQVRGIAASPDGSRIYIVGDFTQVNGQTRNHIAALDLSGNLIADFAPSVTGAVYSVATRGDVVYLGGTFNGVGGVARSRAAAVTSKGTLLPFAPNVADYAVRAIAVSSDSTKILLGGNFSTVNGQQQRGMAAVDAGTGTSLPWAANSVVYNNGTGAAIYSLSTRGSTVYATGYVYYGDGSLEGTVAMNWADGTITWLEDCHGDTYSSVPFNDAVYTAGHAHDCRDVVGGFTQTDPITYHRALAFSQAVTGTLLHNSVSNYSDFGGLPSPTLVASWQPDFNIGTYTGLSQGPWSVAAGAGYLVYGGEFTKVNGKRQTGLVRFLGQAESADTSITTTTPTPSTSSTTTTTPNTTTPNTTATTPNNTTTTTTTATPTDTTATTTTTDTTQTTAPDATQVATTTTATATTTNPAPAAAAAPAPAPAPASPTVTPAPATPSVARSVKAVVLGPNAIGVRWAAPKTNSSAVTGYTVTVSQGKTTKTVHVGASARLAVITTLKRSTAYRIVVTADAGSVHAAPTTALSVKTKRSGPNVSATSTPAKVAKPSVRVRGAKSATVSWKAVSSRGGTAVTGYEVDVYRGATLVTTIDVSGAVRSTTVQGLSPKTTYRFAVRATNFGGWGTKSTAATARTR